MLIDKKLSDNVKVTRYGVLNLNLPTCLNTDTGTCQTPVNNKKTMRNGDEINKNKKKKFPKPFESRP